MAQCPSQMLRSRQNPGKSLVCGSSITLKREKSQWLQTQVTAVELRKQGGAGEESRPPCTHSRSRWCVGQDRTALTAPRSHCCHHCNVDTYRTCPRGPETIPHVLAFGSSELMGELGRGWVWCTPLFLALERHRRQMDFCEYEASLVYVENSRPALSQNIRRKEGRAWAGTPPRLYGVLEALGLGTREGPGAVSGRLTGGRRRSAAKKWYCLGVIRISHTHFSTQPKSLPSLIKEPSVLRISHLAALTRVEDTRA